MKVFTGDTHIEVAEGRIVARRVGGELECDRPVYGFEQALTNEIERLRAENTRMAQDATDRIERGAQAAAALKSLVTALGDQPENGAGTLQGLDLNRAYMTACHVVDWYNL